VGCKCDAVEVLLLSNRAWQRAEIWHKWFQGMYLQIMFLHLSCKIKTVSVTSQICITLAVSLLKVLWGCKCCAVQILLLSNQAWQRAEIWHKWSQGMYLQIMFLQLSCKIENCKCDKSNMNNFSYHRLLKGLALDVQIWSKCFCSPALHDEEQKFGINSLSKDM